MTKAEEHTPGPWEVSGTAVLTSGNPVTQKAICRILGPQDMGPSTEEGYHNARLIASAPQLLEALKELTELMQSVIDGGYKPDSFTLQPAQAAIRAAGGQL